MDKNIETSANSENHSQSGQLPGFERLRVVFTRLIPLLIIGSAAFFAYTLIQQRFEDRETLLRTMQAEHEAQLSISVEHSTEYFYNTYSMMQAISLVWDSKALTSHNIDHIEHLYRIHGDKGFLSELYLIPSGFDSTVIPLRFFGESDTAAPGAGDYDFEEEAEEYVVQMEHMQFYESNPSLISLISGQEVKLCSGEPGLIISVPVRRNERLLGLISGMLPIKRLRQDLNRGISNCLVTLVNDRGQVYRCNDSISTSGHFSLDEFSVDQIAAQAKAGNDWFDLNGLESVVSVVEVPGESKWWLVYQYDKNAQGVDVILSNTYWLAAMLFMFGIVLALLVEQLRKRYAEQISYTTQLTSKEQALRVSAAEYRNLTENSHDMIIRVDREHRLLYSNRAFQQTIGITLDDLLGSDLNELGLSSNVFKLWRDAAERVFVDGVTETVTGKFESTEGTRFFLSRLVPEFSEEKTVASVLITSQDITDRRAVEQRIKKHNDFLQTILDSLPHPFYVLDAKTCRVQLANAAMRRFGPVNEDVTCYNFWHGRSNPCEDQSEDCAVACVRKTGKAVVRNESIYDESGAQLKVEVHASPVLDMDNNIQQIILYAVDVTEKWFVDRGREVVYQISQLFSEIDNLQTIYERLPDILVERLEFPIAILEIYDEVTKEMVVTKAVGLSGDELQNYHFPTGSIFSGGVVMTGEAVVDSQVQQSNDEQLALVKEMGITRYLCCPLKSEGKVFGTLSIADKSGGQMYDSLLQAVQHVADFVAQATQRKHAEQQLKASESRYHELFSSAQEGIGLVDANEEIIYCNQAYAAIFDCDSPDELVGRNLSEFVKGDQQRLMLEESDKRRDGLNSQYEIEIVTSKGNLKTIIVYVSPKFDRDLNYEGAFGSILDITDRKRAESALLESEERFNLALEVSTGGMWDYDVSTGKVYYSERWCRSLGYDPSEVKPHIDFFNSIIHKEDATLPTCIAKRYGAGERVETESEIRLLTKSGEYRWFRDCAKVVAYDDEGNALRVIGTDSDVTERKQTELQLQQTTHSLKERIKELNCYQSLSQLTEAVNLTNEDVLRHAVEIIPVSLQFPKIAGARCILDGKEYVTSNFAETEWSLSADLVVKSEIVGVLEVSYSEEMPDADIGPFQIEERNLLDGVAVMISKYLERKQAEASLAESEIKIRTIVNSTAEAIIAIDENGLITMFNRAAEQIFGYDASESIGQQVGMLLPEKYTRRLVSYLVRKAVDRPDLLGHTVEFEGRHKDGRLIPLELSRSQVKLSDGNMFIGVARDITERRLAEQKLARLASFPENAPTVVVTLDADARITYLNPVGQKLADGSGLTISEMGQILPENIGTLVSDCIASEQGVSDIDTKFGDSIWRWTFHPVRGQQVVHGQAVDMTERIRSEKELLKLSAALSQTANLIFITNPDGVIEYVNPQFEETTGYSSRDAVGHSWNITDSDEHGEEFYQEIWDALRSGQDWSGKIHNRRKNGELYWERKTITPILNDDGVIVHFVSVGEDISAELDAQQQLMESDKMSAIGMLAAGVAHEFKNYLGGIVGNASFALEELRADDGLDLAEESLKKIVEMGEQANEVAMSLLTYSKARPEERRKVDLKPVIQGSIDLIEKEMRHLSIEVVTYYEDVPQAVVSTRKIQQLLLNLLINAQHAIGERGVISVNLINSGTFATINIGDSGSGIPEEYLARVFDPFFSTKGVWGLDEVVGTGMGLSICRNTAREHGGDLVAKSTVGIGTTFTLTLPIEEVLDTSDAVSRPELTELSVALFSVDGNVIAPLKVQAEEVGMRLTVIGNVEEIDNMKPNEFDLVICDARFFAKIELFRVTQVCRGVGTPYVTVNCGPQDFQLGDVWDGAESNFRSLPSLVEIVNVLTGKKKADHQA